MFGGYAYWVGAAYIYKGIDNVRAHNVTSVGDIITCSMSIMVGVMSLIALNPNIAALAKAMVVGQKVFDVIDREPEVKDNKDSKRNYTLK